MSKFKILFGLVAFAFVFSCKAPSTSTTRVPTAPSGTAESIPAPGYLADISYPHWWIEETYTVGGLDGQGRKGSPTVVVFEPDPVQQTYKVWTRTKGGDHLQETGSFSTAGGQMSTTVKGLYFGVNEDGSWNNTLFYNGKKLVRGKADFGGQSNIRLMGVWASIGDLKFPYGYPSGLDKNVQWRWQMDIDGFGGIYTAVIQNPPSEPVEDENGNVLLDRNKILEIPMRMEKATLDFGASRKYRLQTSKFGDYIYIQREQNPPEDKLPLNLAGHNMTLSTLFENDNLQLKLSSTKNAHVYRLQKTDKTHTNGRPIYKWVQLTDINAGGSSGWLDKKQ